MYRLGQLLLQYVIDCNAECRKSTRACCHWLGMRVVPAAEHDF